MNIRKLARFLAGELPNSTAILIADFVRTLQNNLGIEDEGFKQWEHKEGGYVVDYREILSHIIASDKGDGKIGLILKQFDLPHNFIEEVDFSKYQCPNCGSIAEDNDELSKRKGDLLEKFEGILQELESSGNNKYNGNTFESLCESLLLQTSYFEPGFKEFEFDDKTQKIDRLLKLKKNILNLKVDNDFLGYALLEAKYKKKDDLGANEAPQMESYMKRLSKYAISKYGVVITRNEFKETYRTKLSDDIKDRVMNHSTPIYLALITVEEIICFLKNIDNYENMSFDEFIERSFIKWLK